MRPRRTALAAGLAALALAVPATAALAERSRPMPTVQQLAGLNDSQMHTVWRYGHYLAQQRRQRREAQRAVRFARAQLGKPYRFGASGPAAFDCSGLTMRAWGSAGVPLAHFVPTQYRQVPVKVRIGQIRPGDLLMFDGDNHVGIAISSTRLIDAPQTGENVRVDALSGWYRRSFAGAVRPGEPRPRTWPERVVRAYQNVVWWRHWLARSHGAARP